MLFNIRKTPTPLRAGADQKKTNEKFIALLLPESNIYSRTSPRRSLKIRTI